LKRILDTWDRNGSTSGPTSWQMYDDDLFRMVLAKLYIRSAWSIGTVLFREPAKLLLYEAYGWWWW
jgi:hypothetical protein